MNQEEHTKRAAMLARRCAEMLAGEQLDVVAAAAGNLVIGTILQMHPEERSEFCERWLQVISHAIAEAEEPVQ